MNCSPLIASLALSATLLAQQPTTWNPVAGTTPPGRAFSAMAFDFNDSKQVLFGGRSLTAFLGDTWTRDSAGVWTQTTPTTSPGPRAGHGMVAVGLHVYLFGGHFEQTVGNLVTNNELWRYDCLTATWTQLVGTGTLPPGLTFAAVAANSTHGADGTHIVVQGGRQSGPISLPLLSGTTYVYEIATNTWSTVAGTGPGMRERHTLTCCTKTDTAASMVLFGGLDTNGTADDETWLLDGHLSGGSMVWSWVKDPRPGPRPAARSSHTAVFDMFRDRLVLNGGTRGSSILNDTWEWRSDSGANSGWAQRTPTTAMTPRLGACAAQTIDNGKRILMFGGVLSYGVLESYDLTWPSAPEVTIGSGCGNTALYLLARSDNVNALGAVFAYAGSTERYEVQNLIPNAACSMMFSSALANPPVNLGSGCTVYLDMNPAFGVLLPLPNANAAGKSDFAWMIPDDPSLYGAHYYVQAVQVDSASPAGVRLSRAKDNKIGVR